MDKPAKKELLGPEPGKESQKKYGDAFIQARKEFAEQGITHPTGKTPGFRERVQEIYKNLMGDSYKPVYSDSIKLPPDNKIKEQNFKVEKTIEKSTLNDMPTRNNAKVKAGGNFVLLDHTTWDNATDKPILWNGSMIYDRNKKPITERSLVDSFNTIWAFLERKGESIPTEKKKNSVKTMIDRMAKYQSDPSWIDNEKKTKPQGTFNPRNTTTYQYADYDKQLVIDGIPIYSYERDDGDRFIKKPIDEGNFTSFAELRLKNAPDYQLKNGYQAYLNDYIQWEADRCNEKRKENIFGGYLFTDAMVELCEGCAAEQKEKIGKIMIEYRKGGIRTSRLKQMLFDGHTGVDNYFFSDISRVADFQEEQDFMADYFHESIAEFETKAEKIEYLNSSKYLKKYLRLKNHIIQGIIDDD